jgi:hypothetical protein
MVVGELRGSSRDARNPGRSLTEWPNDASYGFGAHLIFLIIGLLETVFLSSTAVVAASAPGSMDTFSFSETIGLMIFAFVLAHSAGVFVGIIGLRLDKDRALALIGAALNAIVPIVFVAL